MNVNQELEFRYQKMYLQNLKKYDEDMVKT